MRATVTFGIFGYLLAKADLEQLVDDLGQADPGMIALAWVAHGIVLFMGSYRWHLFLRMQNYAYTLLATYRMNLIGFFFNAFLPGSTGGDFVKLGYLFKDAPDKKSQAISSITADRLVGVSTLFLLGGVAFYTSASRLDILEEQSNFLGALKWVAIGLILSIFILFFFPFSIFPKKIRNSVINIPGMLKLKQFHDDLRVYREGWGRSALAIFISVLSQLFTFVAIYLLTAAIGISVSYIEILMVAPIIIFAIGMPVSINGHGVREGMFTLMYINFGLVSDDASGRATALAVALLFLGLQLSWSLMGGLVFLFEKYFRNHPTNHEENELHHHA